MIDTADLSRPLDTLPTATIEAVQNLRNMLACADDPQTVVYASTLSMDSLNYCAARWLEHRGLTRVDLGADEVFKVKLPLTGGAK
jgi:hypothetical protein